MVTADTTFPSVLTSASVCYTTRHPFAGLHGRAYEARHGRPPSGFTRSLVVFRDAYASLPHTLHFGNVFKEVVSQRRALLFVLAALRTRLEVVDDVVGGGDDPRTQHCMEYVVEGGQAVFQDVPGLRYVSPCSKLFPQDRDRPLGDLRCSRMSVTLTKHSKLHNRAALHRAVCELDSSPNTPDEAGFCFLEGRHMEVVIDDLRWYLREYVGLLLACVCGMDLQASLRQSHRCSCVGCRFFAMQGVPRSDPRGWGSRLHLRRSYDNDWLVCGWATRESGWHRWRGFVHDSDADHFNSRCVLVCVACVCPARSHGCVGRSLGLGSDLPAATVKRIQSVCPLKTYHDVSMTSAKLQLDVSTARRVAIYDMTRAIFRLFPGAARAALCSQVTIN